MSSLAQICFSNTSPRFVQLQATEQNGEIDMTAKNGVADSGASGLQRT
jgi:hypothetical protein